jgi:MFS transporter, DHA1 family, multidrug resistance protein
LYSNTNKHQLSVALMLAVFSALGPFTVDMYLSSFPQIMRSFGTNASLVQTSLTASLLGLSKCDLHLEESHLFKEN